jgi:hypothetical protein
VRGGDDDDDDDDDDDGGGGRRGGGMMTGQRHRRVCLTGRPNPHHRTVCRQARLN